MYELQPPVPVGEGGDGDGGLGVGGLPSETQMPPFQVHPLTLLHDPPVPLTPHVSGTVGAFVGKGVTGATVGDLDGLEVGGDVTGAMVGNLDGLEVGGDVTGAMVGDLVIGADVGTPSSAIRTFATAGSSPKLISVAVILRVRPELAQLAYS